MADGTRGHHLAELMHRAGILARRDIEAAFGAHFRQAWQNPPAARPAPPGTSAPPRGRLARTRSRWPVQRTVHVDHQRDAGADRLARGKNRGRGGLMQLDRAIAAPPRDLAFASRSVPACRSAAGWHRREFSRACASPISRCSGTPLTLRGEIPQRDVEPGDRKHRDAVAAEQMQIALDLLHERGDPGGIGNLEAARLRRDHLLDCGAGGPRTDVSRRHRPSR